MDLNIARDLASHPLVHCEASGSVILGVIVPPLAVRLAYYVTFIVDA
jgi:hypothetical protein